MDHDYRVFTFVGKNAKGAAHAVYLRSDLHLAEKLKARSANSEDTLVLVATTASRTAPPATAVRFFAKGHEVLRCGSGTLAAAWALSQQAGTTQKTTVQLSTAEENVQVIREGDAYGYTSTPLPQSDLENLPQWENIVRSPILDGAVCGGVSDYVIVELDSEEKVINANPNLPMLTQASLRALVLTAKSPDGYVMRYFAPQYGVPEASVSGSANIQLLRYWFNRLERELLYGRQCSEAGAEFWGLPAPGAVQLFGRVKE